MRARMRSPLAERRLAVDLPVRARARAPERRGRSPSAASQTAGSAISSPSVVARRRSRARRRGAAALLLEALAVAATAGPPRSCSASSRLRATRSRPCARRRRARSRACRPWSGDVLMNSRISSLLGSPSRLAGRSFRALAVCATMSGRLARTILPAWPLGVGRLGLGFAPGPRLRGLGGLCTCCCRAAWRRRLSAGLARRLLALDGPLAARSAISSTASSMVSAAGSLPLRQRGVDVAVLDVGAIAAGQHLILPPSLGMLAEILEHRRRGALEAALAAAGLLLGEQRDGAVDADAEHLLEPSAGWRTCRRAG